MKISKRILGVALALIMIFNVFAVGTFAATNAAINLMISTDKAVYAPGDEVIITLSEQVIDAVGPMNASGQYAIGYNSAAIVPISTGTTPADHVTTDLTGDLDLSSSVVCDTEACAGNGSFITDDDIANYGWDSTIAFCTLYKAGTALDATSAPINILSFKMKIADNAADGTYTIGFNQGSYEAYFGYSTDVKNQGVYGYYDDFGYGTDANYDCGTVTFTVSSGPSVEIAHKGTQSKWKLGDAKPYAENYLFGFVGSFTGITPETEVQNVGGKNRDIVTNIESITATATINGVTKTANVETIWKNTDGSYGFRAQFAGFLPTDTFSASCVFTIVAGGKPYTSAASAATTINAIYTASVGNGLPALVTL